MSNEGYAFEANEYLERHHIRDLLEVIFVNASQLSQE
jgi:hypothetical protein